MNPRPLFLWVIVALAVVPLGPATGFAQDGEFIDGGFVEFFEYVPDFMPPEELLALMESGSEEIVIVDTAAELIWEEERIPGSVNYPWVHELELPVPLPRDKALVLYCACNNHEDSADMAQKLSFAGYLNVKVLEGGWFRWLDLEYPIEGNAVEEGQVR